MSFPAIPRNVLTPLLFLTAVGASAQIVRLDPSKLVLAPTATTPSRALPNRPPVITKTPVRMSQTDYLTLRPQLAALAKVPETALPVQSTLAANLATPGNVLNISVGTLPPAGGGFHCQEVSVWSGYLPGGGFQSYPPVAMARSNTSYFQFTAPIQGPGTFMVTVYLNAPTLNAQVPNVATWHSNNGSEYYFSPVMTLPIQNGKIFVVKEVTSISARELGLDIGPVGMGLQVFSCDFMRIR